MFSSTIVLFNLKVCEINPANKYFHTFFFYSWWQRGKSFQELEVSGDMKKGLIGTAKAYAHIVRGPRDESVSILIYNKFNEVVLLSKAKFPTETALEERLHICQIICTYVQGFGSDGFSVATLRALNP